MPRPDDWTSTWVYVRSKGPWSFTECCWVMHKKDLSNLGEPYLTAVKEARARKTERVTC